MYAIGVEDDTVSLLDLRCQELHLVPIIPGQGAQLFGTIIAAVLIFSVNEFGSGCNLEEHVKYYELVPTVEMPGLCIGRIGHCETDVTQRRIDGSKTEPSEVITTLLHYVLDCLLFIRVQQLPRLLIYQRRHAPVFISMDIFANIPNITPLLIDNVLQVPQRVTFGIIIILQKLGEVSEGRVTAIITGIPR